MQSFGEYNSGDDVNFGKIHIKKSSTADTRTCDWSKVSKEQLFQSSGQHIGDVRKGLEMFKFLLMKAGVFHDHDKLSGIDSFHHDFKTGFKETTWWDNHRKVNRHHLQQADGVPEDVNLIDVIEMITDCVMAGKARSGTVREVNIPEEVLLRAFRNTVNILDKSVIVDQ